MRATKRAAVLLIALWACGGEESSGTEVAVRNGGNASIDATISDGENEVEFQGVAAGTTSTFKDASFDSLAALTVTVGSQVSSADLSEGRRNVVEIGADGKVEAVTQQQAASGGSSDGW